MVRSAPLLAAFLATVLAAPAGAAPHFVVRAGTVAWGDTVLRGDGVLVPRRRLVQHLSLWGGGGGGDASPWTVASDLRIGTDLALDSSDRRPDGVQARTLDLQHAWVRGHGLLWGRADLTIGRLLRWEPLSLVAVDGAHVLVRGPWRLAAEAWAGLLVRRDASLLGYPDLDLDGTITSDEDSPAMGAALALEGWSPARARVGWRKVYKPGRVTGESLYAAAIAGPWSGVRADASGRWDVALRRADHVEAGVAVEPVQLLEVRARAARTRPVFDLDSIFPWFAGGPSDDVSGTVRLRLRPSTAWVRAAWRRFLPGDDAAPGVDAATARGVSAGAALDLAGGARLGATAARNAGYGGGWTSVMLHGTAGVLGDRMELDGRVRWTRFAADLLAGLHGDAWQAVGGAAWTLHGTTRFQATGELSATPFLAPSLRVMGLLDLGFEL